MDASCKIQRSIHAFNITNKSMCPDFWVHIKIVGAFIFSAFRKFHQHNIATIVKSPKDYILRTFDFILQLFQQ